MLILKCFSNPLMFAEIQQIYTWETSSNFAPFQTSKIN